jgi:LmbE family N-acetylglucosaminyl deacetylase
MTLFDIESSPISSLLVIVAHPDDIESWCAGTVYRFTDTGRRVAYVLCTSGDKGTSDSTLTPQQVAAIREAEQQ